MFYFIFWFTWRWDVARFVCFPLASQLRKSDKVVPSCQEPLRGDEAFVTTAASSSLYFAISSFHDTSNLCKVQQFCLNRYIIVTLQLEVRRQLVVGSFANKPFVMSHRPLACVFVSPSKTTLASFIYFSPLPNTQHNITPSSKLTRGVLAACCKQRAKHALTRRAEL